MSAGPSGKNTQTTSPPAGPYDGRAQTGRRVPRVYSKIEHDMLACGMKAMVQAWITRDGTGHYDRACYGGVSVEDALAHYSKTMTAAQGRNPSIKVGRADVIDLVTGEMRRLTGDPR